MILFTYNFLLLLIRLYSFKSILYYDELPLFRLQSAIDLNGNLFAQYSIAFSLLGFLFLKLVLIISANNRSVLWLAFILFVPFVSELLYIFYAYHGEKRLLFLLWYIGNFLLFFGGQFMLRL